MSAGNPTALSKVPTEIFYEIFSYLQHKQLSNFPESQPGRTREGEWNVSSKDWHNEEHPSLQSLRAVNKHFNSVFSPLLFESVVMLHHPGSWKKINNIATSWLAPSVKTLRVATHEDIPVYDNIKAWQNEIIRRRSPPVDNSIVLLSLLGLFGHTPTMIYRDHPAATGSASKVDLSSKQKAYESYRYWADGEAVMREHEKARTAPELRLDLLKNLRRIQTVGRSQLAIEKTKLEAHPHAWSSRWSSFAWASRRAIDSSTVDRGLVQMGNLDLLLRAAKECGTEIADLTLHDPRELAQYGTLTHDGSKFSSLCRLELNFQSPTQPPLVLHNGRAEWIFRLHNLEQLVIVHKELPASAFSGDIFNMFYGTTFPKLASLEARHVKTTYRALNSFIRSHAHTLQSLEIIEPGMSQEDWVRFQSQYSGREGLKKIVLRSPAFPHRQVKGNIQPSNIW